MDFPALTIPLPLRPQIVKGLRHLDTPENLNRIRTSECAVMVTTEGTALLFSRMATVLAMPGCFGLWRMDRHLQENLVVPLLLTDPGVDQALIGLGAWLPFHDAVLIAYYGADGRHDRPEMWDCLSTTMNHGEIDPSEVEERIEMLREHRVLPKLRAMPSRIEKFRR